MLALPPGYASAIFPPAGIAVAAVFIAGNKRALLPIFLGSAILNSWVGYQSTHSFGIPSLQVALLIASASTVQASMGGWWLKRKIGYPTTLDSPRDVALFFLSAPVICLVSATLSIAGLFHLGLITQPQLFSSWASWWIGDSLGLLFMFPLILVAVGRPRAIWRKRFNTVAFPMVVTFGLLVVIFIVTSRWEHKESLVKFEAQSAYLSEQLRLHFESQESVQKQIGALFSYRGTGAVTREDFHNFIKEVMKTYPMIYAMEWAPRVNRDAKERFIHEVRRGVPGFEITELGNGRERVPAADRKYYFPITYIEPATDAMNALMGFDLASVEDRREAILKAFEEKRSIATPPVNLIVHLGEELGLLLMYPISTTSQDGVVSTVLRASSFFGKLFDPLKDSLNIRLYDIQSAIPLYDGFQGRFTDALYTRNFELGGRQYRLEASPTELYFQQNRGWQSWSMLAIGIFGTGLMGALLLLGTGYTARVEAMVAGKTRELKESYARFQEITSTLGEGIYVMDANGAITFVNPKAEELLGRTSEELLGKNAHALIHYKYLDHTPYPEEECEMRRVVFSGQPFRSADEVFWRKDGTPIHIAVNSVPLFRDGQAVAAVVVFDDISERKSIEYALRASEKSFRAIIEHAPIGMTIVSLEGKFMIVNQMLCNIVGYSNDELMRLTFQEITHPDDLTIDLKLLQKLLDGKASTYQMEKRYIRKDRAVVWVQLSVNLLRDENDSPQYFISQIEDITERKLHHEEVEQQAYIDSLTNLPNRRLLLTRLHQVLSQADRYERSMALFFLDLDHFKQVNDSLGHDVGDAVLKEAANRLLGCLRAHDTVARVGGDEFVIILSEISNQEDAIFVAEKILESFRAPIMVNAQEIKIGTSIGIAVRETGITSDVKELMKQADIAMYEAKAVGRNRYHVFFEAIPKVT